MAADMGTTCGSIMVIVGNFKNGTMILEGESHLKVGKVAHAAHHLEGPERSIREPAVLSKDQGETWTPAFDVLFLSIKTNTHEHR